jgi:tripartite-type tricarboxylate transporter receptor subunit TctC
MPCDFEDREPLLDLTTCKLSGLPCRPSWRGVACRQRQDTADDAWVSDAIREAVAEATRKPDADDLLGAGFEA